VPRRPHSCSRSSLVTLEGLRRIIILLRWTRHLRLPGCLTGPLHPRLPSTEARYRTSSAGAYVA